MKTFSRSLPALLFLILLGMLTSASAAQDGSAQIKNEIERLQQSIKDNPISDSDFASIYKMAGDALKSASDALSAGQLYSSLEKIGQAQDLMQGARRGANRAGIEKGGLPAFETEWGKTSLRLTALDKEGHTREWKNGPLAVRALSETAQGKATPLLDGGRGFASANGPKEGLLYLGEAEGQTDFATFCASLNLPAKPSAFPLRSLLPELQRLQEKTNAAFQPPKSIELHDRFIALNSSLKLAQELDQSKFYAGALYSYLEAVRHYGMLDAAPVDTVQQAKLRDELANKRKELAASSTDNSIAQLFLERAESYSSHPDGSQPSAVELKGARVILDQLLPAYYAAEKPASPVQRASGKTVEITLVRWPYT